MTICVLYECCECMCASELSVNSVTRQKRTIWHRTMFGLSASQNHDRSRQKAAYSYHSADTENENSIN